MKARSIWILFALFSTQLASAATLPALQSLDTIQEKLQKSKKSPAIKRLQEAYDLIAKAGEDAEGRETKIAKARKVLSLAAKEREFADYFFWMSSELNLGEARLGKEAEKAAQLVVSRGISILSSHPYSPFYKTVSREFGQAELILGASSCSSKKWASCKELMERGFQRLNMNGDMGFARAENLEKYGEACAQEPSELCGAWIQRLTAVFPKTSPEYKALMKASPSFPEKRGIYGQARLTRTYKAPDLDQVAFDNAMALYLDQKFGPAAVGFRQFLDDFPRSSYRFRAEYWLAQALSHEQKHEDAQKLYAQLQQDSPLTYYGLLASLASGRDISAAIEGTVPQASTTDRALSALELYRLRRAEKLIRGGAPKLAAYELKDIRTREALSSPFLLYLMLLNDLAGNHVGSFSLLSELIARQYEGMNSTYILRFIFPAPYLKLIEAQATENKLDPILVLSLIKQESSFDAMATSSTGAQGLMQLMPTTALDVTNDLQRVQMIAPKTNIQTGTRYLAKLMNRFNGNIVLALAGYNAGPSAVDRWVKASPTKRGMLEFIESIPYKETREYVAAIIRNYFWYSRRLGAGDKAKTLGYFWNIYGPPERPGELPNPSASQDPESREN